MRFSFLVLLLALASPARAEEGAAISWDQAAEHVGEHVTVEGRILGVHCSPTSCLMAFEPTFNRFTAVVQAAHFDVFPPADLRARYEGRMVRVRGTVRMVERKPEIELAAADDLTLVTTEEERHEQERSEKEMQVQMLERIDAVLTNLTDLTERMLQTQERMEQLLLALEQRQAAMAAASFPGPAEPPPAPTYGAPLPRPAFEALRTVKRGMSKQEVLRLIGPPQVEEPAPNGWVIWHYGFGRDISFDARGRAQSLAGFPQP
ncbi:MAG: hypothetical protein KIT14_08750 [bacterium]|nr:hypothetical protein [bacterium]